MSDDLIFFLDAAKSCCSRSTAASEGGRQFIIDTKEDFTRVRIDACLINSDKVIKCDYTFVRHSNEDFYLVELKGTDINHAVDQIINTKNILVNNYIDIPKDKCLGFIVCTKVPHGVDVGNLKQRFRKYIGKDLQISSGKKLIYKPK